MLNSNLIKKSIIFVFSILSRNTYSYISKHSLGNAGLMESCKEQVQYLRVVWNVQFRNVEKTDILAVCLWKTDDLMPCRSDVVSQPAFVFANL